MTPTTVTGPGVAPLTDADIAARARRALVQAVFAEHKANPQALMAAMVAHNIGAAELFASMDYKVNTTHYLRVNGASDGFQGLKVWPASDIDRWKFWKVAQPSPTGIQAEMPSDTVIQDLLDTSQRRKEINPAYVAPWEA